MINTERKYCIAGTGGSGRETFSCLIDCFSSLNMNARKATCFMVDDDSYKQSSVMGVEVISQSQFDPQQYQVIVAIGNPDKRRQVVESLPNETQYGTIIHPTAIISEHVQLGAGAVVTAGVVITCDISIGQHAQINLHSSISHDCVIGDYFTTAQGVRISGNCTIGDNVYFGANSCVKQGVNICNNVLIGMGGVVVKDIMEKGTYIGNPATKLMRA